MEYLFLGWGIKKLKFDIELTVKKDIIYQENDMATKRRIYFFKKRYRLKKLDIIYVKMIFSKKRIDTFLQKMILFQISDIVFKKIDIFFKKKIFFPKIRHSE